MVTVPPKKPTKEELEAVIKAIQREEIKAGIPKEDRMPQYQLEFVAFVQITSDDAMRKKLNQKLKSKQKKVECERKMAIGAKVPQKDRERIAKAIIKKDKHAFSMADEDFKPAVKVSKA